MDGLPAHNEIAVDAVETDYLFHFVPPSFLSRMFWRERTAFLAVAGLLRRHIG